MSGVHEGPVARIAPAESMTDHAACAVVAALRAEGAEVRFVGGCVRDALRGAAVSDVDLATPDPPERVLALLERAGIKGVPTGIEHGTVTAVADARRKLRVWPMATPSACSLRARMWRMSCIKSRLRLNNPHGKAGLARACPISVLASSR